MVCASNQNRSMEAHALLQREGFKVESYGTGTSVKLPGPSAKEPNVYAFGTPYKQILDELTKKDPSLYRRNGLIPMLQRNKEVKFAPQKWQDNEEDGPFDIIVAFEERVFDLIVTDLQARPLQLMQSALVINLDIKDSHEEATVGAKLVLQLCQMFEKVEPWEDYVMEVLPKFEKMTGRRLLYSICFY